MSFAVRAVIARNVRINGISIDLGKRACAFALKSRESTDLDIYRVSLTMSVDENMHPTWHTVRAWLWHRGESPKELPKTTLLMKEFVRDYKGWGE